MNTQYNIQYTEDVITELYTQNLVYKFINQCHFNKFNKKVETTTKKMKDHSEADVFSSC